MYMGDLAYSKSGTKLERRRQLPSGICSLQEAWPYRSNIAGGANKLNETSLRVRQDAGSSCWNRTRRCFFSWSEQEKNIHVTFVAERVKQTCARPCAFPKAMCLPACLPACLPTCLPRCLSAVPLTPPPYLAGNLYIYLSVKAEAGGGAGDGPEYPLSSVLRKNKGTLSVVAEYRKILKSGG